MQLSDFDYDLPAERIAQVPVEPRDAARLLVLDRMDVLDHHHVRDLAEPLRPGDLLVAKLVAVLPACVYGQLKGGGRAEGAAAAQTGGLRGQALRLPLADCVEGDEVRVDEGLSLAIEDVGPDGVRDIRVRVEAHYVDAALRAVGSTPLPPYIRGWVWRSRAVSDRLCGYEGRGRADRGPAPDRRVPRAPAGAGRGVRNGRPPRGAGYVSARLGG